MTTVTHTPIDPDYPAPSLAERRADRTVHLVGLGAAALAVPAMLLLAALWHGASAVTVAALIYAATLVAMLGFSAAYHLSEQPELRDWLRRADHSAIYAKIAGAYTPLTILHGETATLTILGALWGAAAVGMALKIALPRRGDRIALLFYLAMGWSIVLLGAPILEGLTAQGFILSLTGGILYTVGVAFYLWESLPFQNAIWHGLVLAATGFVFAAILTELAANHPV